MNLKKILVNLLCVAIPLALFVVVGEIVIRIWADHHTMYDMEMSRYGRRLKIPSANPLIGHVHKPYSKARLMNARVQINSDGLRDREYPLEKTDRYRVIFLGDSLTFGWGVEAEDTFEHRLEEALNSRYPAEILNFGIGNYNTEQEVNLFLEKGLKYNPDKVVVFYFINDAEPTPQKSRLSFLEHSEFISFYWSKTRAVIHNLSRWKNYQEAYSALYADDAPGFSNLKKAFLFLKKICLEKGIELQVILLPELHVLDDYPFKKEYGAVADFLAENQIQHLDITPFFKDEKNPSRLWAAKDDAHPNALADQMITDFTIDFIATRRK